MINNYSLQISINQKIKKETTGNIYDDFIIGAMLYKYIYECSEISTQNVIITEYVEKYYKQMKQRLNEMKYKYISYSKIQNYLELNNITSFMSLNMFNIESINTLLNDRSIKLDFDVNYFDKRMYLVLKCTTKENNYLKYVHKNIMSRIYYYYRNKYGILQNDIIICSAERATNNAGKIINFKIEKS